MCPLPLNCAAPKPLAEFDSPKPTQSIPRYNAKEINPPFGTQFFGDVYIDARKVKPARFDLVLEEAHPRILLDVVGVSYLFTLLIWVNRQAF